jgi:bisphosphoglycerate-independent phosphoglycerate mutase (AlkP superfamily)
MGTPHRLSILATTTSEADEKLDASIQQLRALAQENPVQGILVTKHGAGRFTVELNDQVPYGETWESVQFPVEAGAPRSSWDR